MLPDTEVQILTGRRISLKVSGAFVGQTRPVRWPQVGRASEKPGNILCEHVQRFGGGIASRDALRVGGKHGEVAIPSCRELTSLHLFNLPCKFGVSNVLS